MSKEKKLSKDELADFVTNLQLRYPKAFFHTEKLLKRAKQAFGQLKQLIEAQAEPTMRKPKVSKKWMGDFTHDVFVFDPSEKYTLYDFLKDKLEEAGLEVEK